MNHISLIGRITRDLELKQTSTGKDIVNYSIAVPIDKDTTEFINCTTFGEPAKTLCNYCSKGDQIGVEGMIRTSQYVDKNNTKHTSTYVLTNRVEFLTPKKDKTSEQEPSIVKDEIVVSDSDLPF